MTDKTLLTPERVRIHLITPPDAEWPSVLRAVDQALSAGVRSLQYRDKQASARELVDRAEQLRRLADRFDALLLINDRLDVALAVGADGVHLGGNDLPWERARRLAPRPFLLGCTAPTAAAIDRASASGADYVGAGPAFATKTKEDTGPRLTADDYAQLKRACERAEGPLPLLAIGGIRPGVVAPLIRVGVDGVAVSQGVFAAQSPGKAVEQILRELTQRELCR